MTIKKKSSTKICKYGVKLNGSCKKKNGPKKVKFGMAPFPSGPIPVTRQPASSIEELEKTSRKNQIFNALRLRNPTMNNDNLRIEYNRYVQNNSNQSIQELENILQFIQTH